MGLILRLLVVAGLAIDAYVHFHLAGDVGNGGVLSEGRLFWIQGVVAALVALLVLVRAHRPSYLIAFLVAGSALGAVLLYRYIDVGALGPLPNMYEPVWYAEKVVTTVAEAVATLAAAVGFWYVSTRARTVRRSHRAT